MVILREQKRHAKEAGWKLVEDKDICCLEEGSAPVGVAVDIGTTTIALTAVALQDRKIIGELSEINRQTELGADVMMRIMHSLSGRAGALHQMVVHQIEQMAERLLEENALDIEEDGSQVQFAVVGNTTMCHLFLDKSVKGLAGYPFTAAYTGNYECIGEELGMEKFVKSKVSVLSGIAAHVGSDALAVIGAERLYGAEKIQLAVDLGTNAEIVLNNRGRLSVCSAAAGPAFEGKGVQCGMPAKAGAVNGVKISAANGNIILEYICGETPKGICGSGLVDAIAALRSCGVLLTDGYLLSRSEAAKQKICPAICRQLAVRNGQNAFVFYRDEQSGKEIYLQQSDIRGVQLAKGAIRAGMLGLLAENKLKIPDVDEIIVAGALGSCIRPANAVKIGLLPETEPDRLRFVGNAAGRGAVSVLTEGSFLPEMEQLAGRICHIELAGLPDFEERLLQSMELIREK